MKEKNKDQKELLEKERGRYSILNKPGAIYNCYEEGEYFTFASYEKIIMVAKKDLS